MHRALPNGYFVRDFLIWGAFRKRSTIVKGYVIQPPDTRGAGDAAATRAHEALVRYLQCVPLDIRLQFQWRCNTDYTAALDAYERHTDSLAKNPKEQSVRVATARHFRRLLAERRLRREHLTLFISLPLAATPPLLSGREQLQDHYRALFDQCESRYRQLQDELTTALGADATVEPMTGRELQLYTFLFFNPSAMEWSADHGINFDAHASILNNCLTSDIRTDRLGRMYLDGHYHGLLVLRQLGTHTFEGMIHGLTKTSLLNYQLSLSLQPLDTHQIIQREETEQRNLQAQAKVDKAFSQTRDDTIARKRAIITKLGEGHTRLFSTTLVIRAWNSDEGKLAADLNALKQAVVAMKNARCYDAHLESTALELFASTFPGNTYHPYQSRSLEIADEHVANLIPYSASFTGDLAQAQALYLSSENSLVGFRFHVNGLVQHTGVAGGTRAGKSVIYNNLLYQTGPFFDYDVLVEEGASHGNYAQDHGSQPIIVQKSGNILQKPRSTTWA